MKIVGLIGSHRRLGNTDVGEREREEIERRARKYQVFIGKYKGGTVPVRARRRMYEILWRRS